MASSDAGAIWPVMLQGQMEVDAGQSYKAGKIALCRAEIQKE